MSHNIFAYCENDFVNKTDYQGCIALADDVVYFGIAVLVIITFCIIYCHTIKKTSWSGINFKNWISKIISAARYIPTLVFSAVIYLAKASKLSKKARATDAPSWTFGKPPRKDEKAKEYAERILNEKYGKGKWKKGSNTEYNKIVKYAVRQLGLK